jgi:hypothetical protein
VALQPAIGGCGCWYGRISTPSSTTGRASFASTLKKSPAKLSGSPCQQRSISSIPSRATLPASSGVYLLFSSSLSAVSPPLPIPTCMRPFVWWSSWASRSATYSGLWNGMRITAVPNRSRFVRQAASAMNASGSGMFSHALVKCSPSHTSSNPSWSASSNVSKSSWYVCQTGRPGGCVGIENIASRIVGR